MVDDSIAGNISSPIVSQLLRCGLAGEEAEAGELAAEKADGVL